MAYEKQTWNTQSYVNPTRMNHIEDGIAEAMPSENMALLGAKNLNSLPYYHPNGRVVNGVTFTINADGTLTANGTASGGNGTFACHNRERGARENLILPNGKYILTGCPSSGSSSKYYIAVQRTYNGTINTMGIDYGNGVEVTLNGDDYTTDEVTVQIQCYVAQNYTANNLVFKPMFRKVGDVDSTWTPYAMTNKQITDVIGNPPLNAGTYTLQLIVDSSGIRTYSWV